MTRTERPCGVCGSWNPTGLDSCPTCGSSLITQNLEEPGENHIWKRDSGLDRFFDKWARTENPILRLLYLFGKGIWMIYMAVVAFILWIIAALPG